MTPRKVGGNAERSSVAPCVTLRQFANLATLMKMILSMRVCWVLVAAAMTCGTRAARAEDTALVVALNRPLKDISENERSATSVFAAYLKLTTPPIAVGDDFNQATIWQGMDKWSEVSKWAQVNAPMGEALKTSQTAMMLGLPYGNQSVDPAWLKAGASISVGDTVSQGLIRCNYFPIVRTISAYATAEMYRLGEAGEFASAFQIGLANARFLRQVCEQSLLEEKLFGLQILAQQLTIQRDFMWVYLDRISSEVLQNVAWKEYGFLKPSDNEKLSRLQMPEGDQLIVNRVLEKVLKDQGSGTVDGEVFAQTLSSQETIAGPLQAFGNQEMWRRIAGVHGSYDASVKKLADVYDDWWRRWKMPKDSPIQKIRTELSVTNPIKYRIVWAMVQDVQNAFAWRTVVTAEVNGTVMSAGLCASYRDTKNTWPKDPERAYGTYFQRRFNFDPFTKIIAGTKRARPFEYRVLSERAAIDTSLGRVWATGCLLYSLGVNEEDDNGKSHSADASTADLVIWPPVRALARQEGLLK